VGVKSFIAVIVAGSPLALIFAWPFELTPEGIKRSDEVPADVSITNKIGRKLLVMMALVAGVAGSLLVWQIVRRSPAAGSATPATSCTSADDRDATVHRRSCRGLSLPGRVAGTRSWWSGADGANVLRQDW